MSMAPPAASSGEPAPRSKRRSADRLVRKRQYLHVGQLHAAAEATTVTTILGSCVAVCLWEPKSRIGGINHFVLPHWARTDRLSPRYGNVAVASLVESLCALGCRVENLKAKIFGGAAILQASWEASLGERNIELARVLLAQKGIPIVGEDVGGRHGRKLVFQTDDGTAWLKRL